MEGVRRSERRLLIESSERMLKERGLVGQKVSEREERVKESLCLPGA